MTQLLRYRLLSVLAATALILVACGTAYRYSAKTFSKVVSGGVTFPKQAVRAVFERMEKNLSVSGESPSVLAPTHRPTTGCPTVPAWWPVGVACAQEERADRETTFPADPAGALQTHLRDMVEVREALLSRRKRQPLVLDWKRQGIIGEAKDGLLVFLTDRSKVSREILARVANENDDRQIIIRAMARAVVAINGVETSETMVSSQFEATRREFAAVRLRLSPVGTWVQLPDGQWIMK